MNSFYPLFFSKPYVLSHCSLFLNFGFKNLTWSAWSQQLNHAIFSPRLFLCPGGKGQQKTAFIVGVVALPRYYGTRVPSSAFLLLVLHALLSPAALDCSD
jgi:hypothetical protein